MLLHAGIGVLVYINRAFAMLYMLFAVGFFLLLVLKNQNKNEEVLLGAAYMVGAEVLFRMTGASFIYEFGKYFVLIFLFIGMFYRGFEKKSWPYLIYLLLLFPGIIFTALNIELEESWRKAVAFNLSGPVCLGVSALYCYGKKMNGASFQRILACLLFPVITLSVYLMLYTPSTQEVVTGTASNFALSGGFGPNQVSQILGLGAFVLVTRLFTINNKTANLIDLGLLALIGYRALLTFSRGGVLTAVVAIFAFLTLFLIKRNFSGKSVSKLMLLGVLAAVVWGVSFVQTNGLIQNRYANEDAAGVEKENISTGRVELFSTELEAFEEKPIFGVGVGNVKYFRERNYGVEAASHNEVSRLLAEHGVFGIFALLILLLAPWVYRLNHRHNYYFLAFYFFWFLTINHSSMRIAIPAFVYGLSLVHLTREKNHLHRKSTPSQRWKPDRN